MENQTYLFELHADHVEWLKSLSFYEDELTILQKRLAEVSSKNTDQNVKMNVEKFQNQFLIQKNEIDYLRHNINASEQVIKDEILANPTASDHRKTTDNEALRNRAEIFSKLFAEMEEEFNVFVGQN